MKELIAHITNQLLPCYPEDEARALALWIIEESTGFSRSEILTGCKGTKNIPNLQETINRLLHFEPIQYIFGHTEWCGLDLKVTPATLIPRPETAELVETITNYHLPITNCRVLDVGTGSGCIAIALKKAHPQWQVTGIDISAEAIEIAQENATRNNVEVDFKQADIFSDGIETIGTFDIVVSNPPYICEKEKVTMSPNVLDFEPASALFVPDDDPLLFYRRIASLKLGKQLFFEINEAYPKELAALLKELGYTSIQVTKDIYGKPRIIEGRMA